MQQVREAESSGFSCGFTSKTVDRRNKPVEFRKKQCNTSGLSTYSQHFHYKSSAEGFQDASVASLYTKRQEIRLYKGKERLSLTDK
jgi:hypothetical protein